MRRLDPDKPVRDEDILKILEYAAKGPTGGNSQPVRWIVVRDADKRRQLGDIYRECWAPVREMYGQRDQTPDLSRVLSSADHLGEHMGDAPVIILPCSRGGVGEAESSVYPGVQNLFLAARALGLGTTLTTVHRLQEDKVRAVLELPADIGLLSLRELAPTIAQLRDRHQLNILGVEALAAATQLDAQVLLSAPSPVLEGALESENLEFKVKAPRSS
jgi:nitroreductase